MDGKKVAGYQNTMDAGTHTFRIQLAAPQSYVLMARSGGKSASIKILNNGNAGANALQYVCEVDRCFAKSEAKGNSDKPFSAGDRMRYVAYAFVDGQICASQEIVKSQSTSEDVVLHFEVTPSDSLFDGRPCANLPVVSDHEGNVYHTVQIGTQCWTKENMRCLTSPSTGTSMLEMYPNSCSYTGKKAYYVDGNPSYAPAYGLLYNWNAAVDTFNTAYAETSVNTSGTDAVGATFNGHRMGICPEGWHVPSDAEWTQLTDYVSSQSAYQCNGSSSNIAKALASATGWNSSKPPVRLVTHPPITMRRAFRPFPQATTAVITALSATKPTFGPLPRPIAPTRTAGASATTTSMCTATTTLSATAIQSVASGTK